MGLGKTYSTKYLVDSNGNTGAANQVLVSTATGVDWADGSGSGIIGGPYLPLAGGTMTGTNGVLFPDNFKLNIGTGSDLQIYHDGSNSFIEDVGTGSLLLKSNGAGIYLKGFTSTDTYAQFLEGGAVNLYYDNSKKFETTSTGVTVTGGGIFTGNVSGVAGTFTGNLAVGTASSAEIYLNRNSANYINAANATGYLVFRTAGAVTALTLNASQNATFAGTVTSPTFLGDLNGTINTATTGVTQTAGDNSTKIATTAYADAAAAAVPIGNYLPLAGGTMTGNLNINTSTNFPLLLTGTNASYTAIGIKNTGTGDAGIYMDGMNGDFSGSDYAFIGQKDEGYLLYNIGASSPLPYHVFTGGNVGIGTTSPGAKLDVVGTTKVGEGVASNTSKLMVNTLSGTAAGIQLFQDGVESWIIQNPASTTALTFGNSGSERMRITSGGNVGIGTTNPGAALHIQSSTTKLFLSNTDFNTSTTTGSGLILHTGASSGNTYGQIYAFQSGNTSYANLVVPGGNVGIGTTDPQVKLETRGTASNTISSTTAVSKIVGNVGTGSVGLYSGSLAGSPNYGTWIQSMRETDNLAFQLLLNPNGGNVGIGTTSPADKLEVLGNIRLRQSLSNAETVYISTNSRGGGTNDADLRLGNSNNGDILTINNANVGIGTVSPGAKLVVSDDSTTIASSITNSNSGGSGLQITAASGTNNILQLRNYLGGEVMRVRGDGNVGIGTTNPGYKLEVNNTSAGNLTTALTLNNGSSTTNTAVALRLQTDPTSTVNSYSEIRSTRTNSPAGGGVTMQFLHTNSTSGAASEMMRLSYVGLGIGTAGTTTITDTRRGIFADGTAAAPAYSFSNDTNNGMYRITTDTLGFSTAGSEKLRISSVGNVSIGNGNNTFKLDVTGTGRFTDNVNITTESKYFQTTGAFLWDSSTTLGVRMGTDGVAGLIDFRRWLGSGTLHHVAAVRQVFGGSNRYGLGFLANDISTNSLATTVRMYIDPNNGDVGIGTTSPGYKLDVTGTGNFAGNLQISTGDQATTRLLLKNTNSTGGRTFALVGGIHNVTQDGFSIYDTVAAATRLAILNTGNVGIGNNNDTYKLDVSGTGRFTSTVTATNFILSSDKTLKDNISDINTDHVDVKWKNFELKSEPGVKRAGVIAQELEEKHPEFVRTDKDGIKSVAYIDLLIAKIAELEARLEKAGL